MSRVFAVCSLLGFGNLREYCGRVDELTLFTVERYVDFKEGEVWERTKEIFENEGLVPTGPDRQVMDEAIVTARMTAAELADAIQRLVEDEGLRARLGRAGREKVCAEFDIDRTTATLADLLRRSEPPR